MPTIPVLLQERDPTYPSLGYIPLLNGELAIFPYIIHSQIPHSCHPMLYPFPKPWANM